MGRASLESLGSTQLFLNVGIEIENWVEPGDDARGESLTMNRIPLCNDELWPTITLRKRRATSGTTVGWPLSLNQIAGNFEEDHEFILTAVAGAEMSTETNTEEISSQDENDPPVNEVEASSYQLHWFSTS